MGTGNILHRLSSAKLALVSARVHVRAGELVQARELLVAASDDLARAVEWINAGLRDAGQEKGE